MIDPEQSARIPARLSILHDSDTDRGRVMLRKRWSPALERDQFEMTMDGNRSGLQSTAGPLRAELRRVSSWLPVLRAQPHP